MVGIVKGKKVLYNVNLVQNQTFIYIRKANDSKFDNLQEVFWDNATLVYYTKYQIKETDMRIKTATFSSPNYVDLTTGVYCVLITSPYHEDFAGVILNVEKNDDTGIYDYQCQDFSRRYQGQFELVDRATGHSLLRWLISRGQVPIRDDGKQAKKFERTLSGLRPPLHYQQGENNGSRIKFNPMTQTYQLAIRNKTFIEAIRDFVFGTGAYIDVYFNKYGIIQIEPYTYDDFYNTGLRLYSKNISSKKLKFDTTNAITSVIVLNNDKTQGGNSYKGSELVNLDLSAFFGKVHETISNPNPKKTTTTTTKNNATVKQATKKSTKEGTGITVFMNSDVILGNKPNSTVDKNLCKSIGNELKKKGYKVEYGGVDPNYHYSQINRVKKNGIYFTLYGGRCAGTLKEQCESSHYHSVLKKKNAKMVIGFYKKKLTDAYLPRAHDDNFSPKSFKGWSKPRTKLLNAGVGIAQGNTAKEIASTFPGYKKKK